MVFSSLVFLWLFLPVTVIGNFLIKDKYRNVFLLLASLFFYSWGEPIYIFLMLFYIFLMLFSILINWMLGLIMEKYAFFKKVILCMAVLANLIPLGYFKYFNFFVDTINNCLNTEIQIREIALPIGISFYTFQALSYIIDLYYGKYKAQKNIINMALYISFFPQLIAGPIVKYNDINEQIKARTVDASKTAEGIRRFIYGLSKKVLVANVLAKSVDAIYALEYPDVTCKLAWLAAIFYTLQIYYDFSGYSDMAIGLGKIFGFDIKENFQYPYISRSVREFWQRWHISLSSWFKEYLYIPLGGNRNGKIKTYINLIIVFLVTGLWHGAGCNFILWGLYHGFFSIIERIGFKKFLERHKIFSHIYMLLVVNFGWVLFRAENVMKAAIFVKHMLMPWKYTNTYAIWQLFIGNKVIFIAIIGIVGCGMMQKMFSKFDNKWKNSYIEMVYCSILLVLCIASLASNTYNPFIYFRF